MAIYRLVFVLLFGLTLRTWAEPAAILEGKIPECDQRYHTFYRLFELLQERNARVIVETGTARQGAAWCTSDGCSTLLFAQWIHRYGGVLYSVDIDPMALSNAAQAIDVETDAVYFMQSDSIAFLKQFEGTIDCLYLDSYDFDMDNPTPSQEHHLKEIQAAYPHLSSHSVVMIDDCALPHGGKGKLVIEFLQAKGWRVIADGYQVILIFEPILDSLT